MKTKMTVLIAISIVALFLAATALACGSQESTDMERLESVPAASAPASAAEQAMQAQEAIRVIEVPGETVIVEKEVLREVEVEKTVAQTRPAAPASQTIRGADDGLVPQPAQLVTQRRIIIRIVNMSIVVDEIQAAIDDIARIADEAGERVTATVTHSYDDPRDSPFIVQVKIDSFGESGVAEGEDTLIVSVSETPVIEVFVEAGSYNVLQNEAAEFSASFTRPPGLTDVRYKWDFGDGSPPEEGQLAEGITRVDASHAYTDFRSWPYDAVFTVTAESAVGEIVASNAVSVYVEEYPGLIVGGFDVADTTKTAIRTLSLVFSGLTTAAIWLGIFAIIWAPLAVVVALIIRRNRRIRSESPTGRPNPSDPQDEPAG
jgi:hypothetical protein